MNFKTLYKIFIFSILLGLFSTSGWGQQATVTIDQNPKIPKLLSLKKNLEKENKLSDGYTIQLYYGELNKANSVIKQYRNSFGNWPASIEYETPNYKVWVGNFSSRLEADRALIDIHQSFPAAFILKPERKK